MIVIIGVKIIPKNGFPLDNLTELFNSLFGRDSPGHDFTACPEHLCFCPTVRLKWPNTRIFFCYSALRPPRTRRVLQKSKKSLSSRSRGIPRKSLPKCFTRSLNVVPAQLRQNFSEAILADFLAGAKRAALYLGWSHAQWRHHAAGAKY